MTDIVRVFAAAAANNEDLESQAVLEWSIRKHASLPVEITWMQLSTDPASPFHAAPGAGWNTSRWATPFSGFRWAIPEICAFEGKAIYCDSDVIFLADVAELWRQAHPDGTMLLAKGGGHWRICVSMWDCARARAHLPALGALQRDPDAHRKMGETIRRPGLVAPFSGEWNCLDKEVGKRPLDDPAIKALHYTDMRCQPQLRHALPRLAAEGGRHWFDGQTRPHFNPRIEALFDALLAEAAAEGYGIERYRKTPFGAYTKRSFAA